MATDIAVAIGVVSLLGSRVAPQLKLFLLALAIADDIGAIAVIALFYSDDFDGVAAGAAVAILLGIVGLRLLGVRAVLPYLILGVGAWVAVHEGGVHATIAGVVLGLLAPTRPFRQGDMIDADQLADVSTVETARQTVVIARESVSVVEWLEHRLHRWTSYLIVPVFALANAGVVLDADTIESAATSPVTHGIVAGLVVGKLVGISAFAWLACRVGLASLPAETRFAQIVGVAALAGIGFTVSLFVSELAFGAAPIADEAKVGILAASLLAAGFGTALLLRLGGGRRRDTGPAEAGPEVESIVA